MKALHFGAGNIGRGFIGGLLSESGYEVTFVDVNEEIVDLLNEKKAYTIVLADEEQKKTTITDVKAINSQKTPDQVIEAIKTTNLITTAVGPNVLPIISRLIANGLSARIKETSEPLTIIACENMIGASSLIKNKVYDYLHKDEINIVESCVSFPNSAVDRIVPNQTNIDKLLVSVEPYYEWVIDQSEIIGDIPPITGATFAGSLSPFIERKLFTVNTGHCITAYLGYLAGHSTIKEAIDDEKISDIVKGALIESGKVLVNKHGFDQDGHIAYIEKIINRFKNPFISDEVVRVGRSPMRKLGYNDRLISPAVQYADAFGTLPSHLLQGITAGYLYDYPEDTESVEIQQTIREQGIAHAIHIFSGLDEDHPLAIELADSLRVPLKQK